MYSECQSHTCRTCLPRICYALLRASSSAVLSDNRFAWLQKVFQGGSVADLHALLGIKNASRVLYVGDHIYGDILRSKKARCLSGLAKTACCVPLR